MKQRLWRWMLNTLSKPRKQLDGLPICPYLNRYKNNIQVVETQDPSSAVIGFAAFKDLFDLEAVVVYGFESDWDYWHAQIDKWNETYADDDTVCLYMDPDSIDPPIDIDYTWRECAIIVVQRASTLATNKLHLQKTAYYTHYSSD